MDDYADVDRQESEVDIAMDEENSDEYEQEECVDPRTGFDGFEEDSNETGEDIPGRGSMDKEGTPDFNQVIHMEPFVGMEFESHIAAGKFYSSYARSVGFETKIRQSRSNRMHGKWYVQFSCNKEGFRRTKPEKVAQRKTDRSDRPDIRCGCLATMKVKLMGHNKWRVFKVNLVHNHTIDPSKAPRRRSRNLLENSAECSQDECLDPSTGMEGIEDDPDDMEEEISEINTIEIEKAFEYDQNAFEEPVIGMEFESYVAAGKFYNSYAKHAGFETKIRQSRSNLKHGKRYVQFSCNKEGFKRARTPRTACTKRDRPDIRCGCLATMKIKLTGQNKWRVFHVNLIHNHEIGPRVANKQKSRKQLKSGVTRRSPLSVADPNTNGPSQKSFIEAETPERFPCHERDNFLDQYRRVELRDGDVEAIHLFFDRMQSRSSNFFYSLDLNEEGHLRNVFWVDSRSRAAYEYFGDVVTFDTTCLTNNYNLKLAMFVGVNHHGQPVLLGCGLLSSEAEESFTWLFRTWLMAMSDHSPYAIISDQVEAIQGAVAEVFPHSHYRFCLLQIMKKVMAEFGSLARYNEIKKAIRSVIYDSLRVHEFERDWNGMITKFSLHDNQWLNTLYKLREKWVPCFLKYGFWAGMSSAQNERVGSFFNDYLHPATCLRDFFEQYELALNSKYAEEAFTDFTNFKCQPSLDQAHWFEAQLVNVYTMDIFKKFQQEINGMVRCYDMSPIHVDDTITTYMLKERIMDTDGRLLLPKEYEVFYNKVEVEVTCICNLFQFEGFLCRHSLYILQNHGVIEIPSRYIIARWRKDYKHNRSLWYNSTNLMPNASMHWHDILHKKCRRIVEEGVVSERGYLVALQVLDEGLRKVLLENDAAIKRNVGHAHPGPNRDVTLENAASGSTSPFYSNLQGRADESNSNRPIFDLERAVNSEKNNSCLATVICESCMASDPLINAATNVYKKRRISPIVTAISNCNPPSEMLFPQTTHDLLGFSTVQQGITPLAPYFCTPPTFPGYVPLRYPSASVMVDNGFVPFNQVPPHSHQAHKQ